jgi:O-antigen ligase/polysaccharide polymerase Wzy-like membrane protein
MTLPTRPMEPPSSVPAAVVSLSLALLAVAVVAGGSVRLAGGLVVVATIAALVRPSLIGWPRLIAALILIIMFIPIRRYTLPANLPFQLEPYRVFVALLVLGWLASLLVDARIAFRRTGFEGPLLVIVGAAFASIVANPGRVAHVSTFVNKSLMFFLSFVLVLYLIASVIRRLEDVDYLAKTLVITGTVVAISALVEARTGFNVFNHLSRVFPFLQGGTIGGPEFIRAGTGRLRVFGSAEHPIALSAALVMIVPLAIYLARCHAQRRWIACALALSIGAVSTVSRTGIVMFVVIGLVYLWLRPRETKRLWPALVPALIVIHFAVPGTLGSIKNSFMPPGGLVAEQESQAGKSGSGRLADLGPGIREWKRQPLVGQGFGTRVVASSASSSNNNILDDQWLGTLLETGVLGFFGWLWFFARAVRRFGREAKQDDGPRGWLLTSITASVAAYAIGMVTYDAFSFIQVTFLLFILVGLGTALIAERTAPVTFLTRVRRRRDRGALPAGDASGA